MGVAAVAIVVYSLAPVVWITSLSLKAGDDINNQQFWPTQASLENYDTVFGTDLFTSALRNSIGIALIATVVSLVIATCAAYAISRLEFPGRRTVLNFALAVSVFPAISIATPLFTLWREIGLYDTWLGLIIPYMSLTLPVSLWMLSSYFREIPRSLEQAAQVDGASTWQTMWKVIVPLAAPGVFTTAIIAFLTAWNDFVFGITLTSTERARHGARGACVLHRRVAVPRADGRDRGGVRGGDDPGRDHRPALPAADRRRPHERSRQGLRKEMQ